ncbi:hypothetical protein HK405_009299 [Cladochytrium tenue]|nr:hypothetical protein HK405_009299 [Cladochytrium tenue]
MRVAAIAARHAHAQAHAAEKAEDDRRAARRAEAIVALLERRRAEYREQAADAAREHAAASRLRLRRLEARRLARLKAASLSATAAAEASNSHALDTIVPDAVAVSVGARPALVRTAPRRARPSKRASGVLPDMPSLERRIGIGNYAGDGSMRAADAHDAWGAADNSEQQLRRRQTHPATAARHERHTAMLETARRHKATAAAMVGRWAAGVFAGQPPSAKVAAGGDDRGSGGLLYRAMMTGRPTDEAIEVARRAVAGDGVGHRAYRPAPEDDDGFLLEAGRAAVQFASATPEARAGTDDAAPDDDGQPGPTGQTKRSSLAPPGAPRRVSAAALGDQRGRTSAGSTATASAAAPDAGAAISGADEATAAARLAELDRIILSASRRRGLLASPNGSRRRERRALLLSATARGDGEVPAAGLAATAGTEAGDELGAAATDGRGVDGELGPTNTSDGGQATEVRGGSLEAGAGPEELLVVAIQDVAERSGAGGSSSEEMEQSENTEPTVVAADAVDTQPPSLPPPRAVEEEEERAEERENEEREEEEREEEEREGEEDGKAEGKAEESGEGDENQAATVKTSVRLIGSAVSWADDDSLPTQRQRRMQARDAGGRAVRAEEARSEVADADDEDAVEEADGDDAVAIGEAEGEADSRHLRREAPAAVPLTMADVLRDGVVRVAELRAFPGIKWPVVGAMAGRGGVRVGSGGGSGRGG